MTSPQRFTSEQGFLVGAHTWIPAYAGKLGLRDLGLRAGTLGLRDLGLRAGKLGLKDPGLRGETSVGRRGKGSGLCGPVVPLPFPSAARQGPSMEIRPATAEDVVVSVLVPVAVA